MGLGNTLGGLGGWGWVGVVGGGLGWAWVGGLGALLGDSNKLSHVVTLSGHPCAVSAPSSVGTIGMC